MPPGAPSATRLARALLCVHNLVFVGSDGTLNPNGVRFGSSEIYNIGMQSPFLPVIARSPGKGRGPGGTLGPAWLWQNTGPSASSPEPDIYGPALFRTSLIHAPLSS